MSKIIPKIPQNNKEFYIFTIDEYFFSLNIQFNHKSKINLENLFMIIRSYLDTPELIIQSFLVISEDVNNEDSNENNFKNTQIYHYVNPKKLKKMTFFDFKEWFYDLKQNDNEYIVNMKYYGFKILFNKNSIYYKEKKIFPIYP